jgi:hypothetical protein
MPQDKPNILVIVPAAAFVTRWLESFKEFPPPSAPDLWQRIEERG